MATQFAKLLEMLSKFVWKGRGNCTEMTRCAFAKSSVAHGQYIIHAMRDSAVLILILGCTLVYRGERNLTVTATKKV